MTSAGTKPTNRCLFPRYRALYGATGVVGLLLVVPLIIVGPGHDGSFIRAVATALAALAIGILINHQGALYVGDSGLAVVQGCWTRRVVRWSEVTAVLVTDAGITFRTIHGGFRLDPGCWYWTELLKAITSRLRPAVAAPLLASIAPRGVGCAAFGGSRWNWPGAWVGLALLLALGGYQLVLRVPDGSLQARVYFQGVLLLLIVGRMLVSSRELVSAEIDTQGMRLQTAGEPAKIRWPDVLAIVDTPRRWVVRTRQGDFGLPKRYSGGRGMQDALVARGVPRVIYEPGPPVGWSRGG